MLKDKIVLITGASSGIGLSIAKYFAKEKVKLLLCARRIEMLTEFAQQLKDEHGIDVYPFKLDVTQYQDVEKAQHTLPQEWRSIDILVNNAGLAAGLDNFQDGNIEDWEIMIDTNLKGLLYMTRAVLPQMLERNKGHIINIGSIAGHETYPKGNVYCATKHAVSALTKSLRGDLLGTNIRVSTVDPGAVETNFSMVRFKGDKDRAEKVYQGMTPLTADDVADAVLYCATRPSHVNINQIIIMPTDQASATLVSRQTEEK